MISEEKMTHIINLMLGALEKEGFLTFTDKSLAIREAKKAGFSFVKQMESVKDIALQRINSQKNPPPEYSSQWNTLFQKYYEEELKKKGG
jgi:hypothetical protein